MYTFFFFFTIRETPRAAAHFLPFPETRYFLFLHVRSVCLCVFFFFHFLFVCNFHPTTRMTPVACTRLRTRRGGARLYKRNRSRRRRYSRADNAPPVQRVTCGAAAAHHFAFREQRNFTAIPANDTARKRGKRAAPGRPSGVGERVPPPPPLL